MDAVLIPAATLDTDTILVAFDLNVANTHPGWSANVHDNNIYYTLIGTSSIAVSRISGPWWMVNGSDIGQGTTNLINISCSETGANTVSITAYLRQASAPYSINLDWSPPYMDIFQNSFMRLPFDDRAYSAGNDLTFTATTDDPSSFKTIVRKSSVVNYTFLDPAKPSSGTSGSVGKNKLFQRQND